VCQLISVDFEPLIICISLHSTNNRFLTDGQIQMRSTGAGNCCAATFGSPLLAARRQVRVGIAFAYAKGEQIELGEVHVSE